ncbi:MAG: DUF2924 domain-containing protein [Candidatus Omnitrophica bacterium]|nr:DUF2924 domain-containing protein [Candidatus Omnitrophota bacterium]
MPETLSTQIEALKETPINELQKQYKELFKGEAITALQATYLQRKIAYKLQELECGGLSAKAKQRLETLIQEYEPINNKALRPDKPVINQSAPVKDRRLPIPGTIITKKYKGTSYQIKVLEKGFEYKEKIYKSLTAVAQEMSGAHWNGYLFFNL